MRGSLVLSCLLLLTSFPCPAVEQHPMTPRDLWSIQRPQAPAVSPDGTLIAYQMTTWDLAEMKGNTDLWTVPLQGGTPRRLTSQPGTDRDPAWSPEGNWIYFISSRSDKPAQVYRLPAAGGEAEPVTDFPEGVGGFQLDAGGQWLLVAASSYKDCADADCIKKTSEAAKGRKETGRLFDALLYRHWNSWRGDERSHVFLFSLTSKKPIRDLTPGDAECPPLALGSDHDFVFSPDGRLAALVLNRSELAAASTDSNIELVNLFSEGKPLVVSPAPGNDAAPRFDSKGRLFWLSQPRAGYEADRAFLMMRDPETGQVSQVFSEPDLSVAFYQLLGESDTILFTAQEKGRQNLYRVLLASGKVELLLRGGNVKEFDPAPGGKTAVIALESLSLLPELYRLDLENGELSRLTGHNDALAASLELGTPAEYWFKGGGGEMVHALVVLPPPSLRPKSGKIPVILQVHGGPQGAWLDEQHARWNMQQFAAFGYIVVGVNFHGSTGYGQPFTDSINQDWGGKPFQDVSAALEALPKEIPQADTGRVCAAGGSYGGYLVNWLLGHTGDRYRCFVSHAGLFDMPSFHGGTEELWFPEWDFGGTPWSNPANYQKWNPAAFAGEFKTPTLVVHGELDFRVPVTQGMHLFTTLQRQRIPSKFLYFPDEGHFVGKPANALLWWKTLQEWFAAYLK